LEKNDGVAVNRQDGPIGSGANGPAASVTVTFGELMTNDERIE
jgi:hypothetical protein